MTDKLINLPYSDNLNILTFSKLLDKTTNSYKFIFFLSILEILISKNFNVSAPISLREIAVEMLVISWYPHCVFKLFFGFQDTIPKKLDSLNLNIDKPILEITKNDKNYLRQEISRYYTDDDLVKYVPFRLIRPFFKELNNFKDYQVNQQIKLCADKFFDERKPLYRFNENATSIIFHPEWATYIKTNYQIILAWVSWNWLKYMQKYNPNVPSLAIKLFPPQGSREQMQSQTSYWKLVLRYHQDLRCIYSSKILTLDNFSLDHYLPWTFVAHNQLWNLVPTTRAINSSKSNKIPNNIYFENFVQIQYLGLITSHKYMKSKIWEKQIESYISDLRFSSKNDLLQFAQLKKAYELQMQPLIALATSQGFENDWIFRQI